MVLQDSLFSGMSLDTMQKVLGPKIDGTNNLDQLFHDDELDFFVLFSSSACVIGNSGQANYAAANGYLNSLARQRRKRGLAASVVDIGRVAGIGYVETAGQAVINQLTRFGLMAISESEFHQMFAETIRAGYPDPKDKEAIPDAVVTTGIRTIRDDEDIQGPWFDNPRFSHCIVETKTAASNAEQQNKTTTLPVSEQLSRAATMKQALEILQGM
jgi:hybrid polyketide synthase / nonribosomal peptide synthetase ACE1